MKKRIAIYSVIALVLLFFFFAPVYRTTIYFQLILPFAGECGIVTPIAPQAPTIYVSLSYAAYRYLSTSEAGAFGLIYVPNNGWNSIQFPPIGYHNISCS